MHSFSSTSSLEEENNFTDDAFLDGKIHILQPLKGYRAGIDAVLLASTIAHAHRKTLNILDCGAGVGTVGLCVAVRCPSAVVTLVEKEDLLCELAQQNILRNGLQNHVTVVKGDLTLKANNKDAPKLKTESFDYVLANPPFHITGQNTKAKNTLKNISHTMDMDTLDLWIKFAARLTRPGGRYTLIHKAAELSRLTNLLKGRFGNLTIRPIHSNIQEKAIRILIEGQKGSKKELQILPPLILHKKNKEFTRGVSRILREGLSLTQALDPIE